jgi:3-deoxy-D-manno-octulosonic-acid transferase
MIWRVLDLIHALLCLFIFPIRWTRWGKMRVKFENDIAPSIGPCDWSFEVSSEGEFEQVKPWLYKILLESQKIELVYASPSVKKSVESLALHFQGQVRLIPLPLITHSLWFMVRTLTAPKLVLCRYDFFPSLMSRASVVTVTSGVVWASFKRRRHRLKLVWWRRWYRMFYGTFAWVVPATREDENLFKKLGGIRVLPACEMRVPQIRHRLSLAQKHLEDRFPHWDKFHEHITNFSIENRWIMGSVWNEDLDFINNQKLIEDIRSKKVVLMVIPHLLGSDWREKLAQFKLEVFEINGDWDGEIKHGGIWLINLKGVLCELYSYVGYAYVGGGFTRSVHSVLEPFVAGSKILCGPKVHRSTEVEAIESVAPLALRVIPDKKSLPWAYSDHIKTPVDLTLRHEWLDNQNTLLEKNLIEVSSPC